MTLAFDSKRGEPLREGLRRGANRIVKAEIPARPRASTQRRQRGRAARFDDVICATPKPFAQPLTSL